MKKILISSICVLNLCISSFAQENGPITATDAWNELYKSVVNEYGFDQVLVNGICYEDEYLGTVGHPFLLENQYYKGKLIYRDREYKGLDIKYDVYKQQVILYISQNKSNVWIIPPNDFISSFSIGDKLFVKYTFQGVPRFYQAIFDTKELKCLYYWSKLRYDSDHKGKYNSYRFTESGKRTYLIMDDELKKYKDNRSFVRLFPQESKVKIKQYMRNNKIKVAISGDVEMEKLVTFCKALL